MIVSSDKENAAGFHEMAEQIRRNRQRDEYDERDLKRWKEALDELKHNVSKPYIPNNKQYTGPPFIMPIGVNQQDKFDREYRDVCIKEEGQLACHKFNLFGNSGEIRGKREYNFGVHRIQLKIEHLDAFPWWFFGIISKFTPMRKDSHRSSSTYGWAGHDEIYMNGKDSKNLSGYISDYSKGDIIELIIDCDNRRIHMKNLRSAKFHEMNVDLTHCPFPWMIHLNLFHIQTCIRICS
jgi:hypothetical protein